MSAASQSPAEVEGAEVFRPLGAERGDLARPRRDGPAVGCLRVHLDQADAGAGCADRQGLEFAEDVRARAADRNDDDSWRSPSSSPVAGRDGVEAFWGAGEDPEGLNEPRGTAFLKATSFLDIGLLSLSAKIGVESQFVRRSRGFMKRLFENTRDILPISMEKACEFFGEPSLLKYIQTPDHLKAPAKLFGSLRKRRLGGRQRSHRVRRIKRVGWALFILQNLNAMMTGGFDFSRSQRSMAFSGPPVLLDCHVHGLKNILETFSRFDGIELTPSRGLSSLIDSLDVGEVYGCKKYPAEKILFSQHSLPEKCCCVDAESILWQAVPWISQPHLILRDDFSEIPPALLRPKKVWADDEQWNLFAEAGLERGLFAIIPEEEVFCVNGKKILSGGFAVPKAKKPGKPILQRFVLNLINEIFDMSKASEISKPDLPYASSFTVIAIHDGQIIVAGEEDENGCFNLYFLPKVWRKFFALSKLFTDREGNQHRVALTGVPMGWTFSVGLIQQIQRFFLSQVGADPQQEIRPISQIFPDYILSLFILSTLTTSMSLERSVLTNLLSR